ncbi:MAG: efflux RND transporter periplasmic adaptor subunit [Gemmataceae bacterium]|nr:efflux RND transporter periplasmic adaptor subunit [Gemmataceae bacterium]
MSAIPTHSTISPDATRPETRSPIRRLAFGVVFVVVAAVVFWRWEQIAHFFAPPEPKPVIEKHEVASVASPGLLIVDPDSSLRKNRLGIAVARREEVQHPLLNVTGSVMARLAVGKEHAEARWDFAAADVAAAYGDWLKARADETFAKKQVDNVQGLHEARIKYLTTAANLSKQLVGVGTDTKRDLDKADSELKQADIQGQKDIFEAETTHKTAIRTRGLLERQLLQAGVDPAVVLRGAEGLVLIVADVPETKVSKVDPGQACEARFVSFPGKTFQGKVGRLGPSISREKRTLRVTFELNDPQQKLLPGMFADIGLGTETRSLITIPAEAVLHSGRSDYVLKEEGNAFRVVEVQVEEQLAPKPNDTAANAFRLPVSSGISEGDRVVSAGAILLKPAMVKALQPHAGHPEK